MEYGSHKKLYYSDKKALKGKIESFSIAGLMSV